MRAFWIALFIFASLPAAAVDCRSINNDTDRLKCYDGGKTTYHGKIALPQFGGRDQKFSQFRSRIRKAMTEGPNFASHMTIIQIGCGTGCSLVVAGDVRSGELFEFPLGGDEQQSLDLRYQIGSNRIIAFWQDSKCHKSILEWDSRSFLPIDEQEIGEREACFQQ